MEQPKNVRKRSRYPQDGTTEQPSPQPRLQRQPEQSVQPKHPPGKDIPLWLLPFPTLQRRETQAAPPETHLPFYSRLSRRGWRCPRCRCSSASLPSRPSPLPDLHGDGSFSLTLPQSPSKAPARIKSGPATISERRPVVREQPRRSEASIGRVTAVPVAACRYRAAELPAQLERRRRGRRGGRCPGGCRESPRIPGRVPDAKVATGRTGGTSKPMPETATQTTAASPKTWGHTGSRRCLEPPK